MATSTLNPTASAWTPDQSSQQRGSNSTPPATPSIPLSFNAAPFIPQQAQWRFDPIDGYFPGRAEYNAFFHPTAQDNGSNHAHPTHQDPYHIPQKYFAKYHEGPDVYYPYHPPLSYQDFSILRTGFPPNAGHCTVSDIHAQDPFDMQMRQVDNMRAMGYYSHGGETGWRMLNGNVMGMGMGGCAGRGVGGGETKRKKKGGKKKKKKGGERMRRKDSKMASEGEESGVGNEDDVSYTEGISGKEKSRAGIRTEAETEGDGDLKE